MANWLERAKREIPQDAGRVTAIADKRNPTAVTAVAEPSKSDISRASIGSNGSAQTIVSMTETEEAAIRAWLAHIEETDEAIIDNVLKRCRSDGEARAYFIQRAGEVPCPDQGIKHGNA